MFSKDNFCNKDSMSWKGDTPFRSSGKLKSFQSVGDNAWICDFFAANIAMLDFFAALLTKQSRKVYIYLEPEISIL